MGGTPKNVLMNNFFSAEATQVQKPTMDVEHQNSPDFKSNIIQEKQRNLHKSGFIS
jgi:hypothetical protein